MKITFEVNNTIITDLIYDYVRSKLGEEANVKREDIKIEVQSKQNYRVHEWEKGELRVRYEGDV